MGNFRSIEEVERMASIVSDMEKSKPIGKGGPYDMYIMLARQNGKNKHYEEQLARLNATYMLDERDSIIKHNK